MNDMTHANYTHGFSGGVTIRGMPVLNSYGGNVYWVDSAGAASGAGTFQRPFLTIDAAVGNCTANNGDFIMVKPGHAETVSAAAGLDLDVAGITIVFLGNDTDRGTITFNTDVLADMDVDAADITMFGPRFVMGLDNVTAPIDVNSAGFKLINTTIEDGAGFAPPDWIVADANADDMTIDGLLYRESTTGTQNESLIQIAGATRPIIRNVRATGNFATAIIENGTAWVDATLENLVLDNANVGPTVCILLQATSSGWVRNSSLRVSSGSTGYTANNDMQFDNVNVTGTDAAAASDPTIGNLADTAATGAPTTTDTLVAYIKQLVNELQVVDEFHDVPAADNTLNAQINEVIGNKTDAAASGAVTTTDTLVGYVKQLVTELAVVDEFHDVPAADNTLNAQINEVIGNKTDAAATGAVTTTDTLVGYTKQVVTDVEALQVAAAPSKSHPNYFTVTADMTSATWNTVAAHEIATVTGAVRMQIMVEVAATVVTTGTNGTIALGYEGNTAAIFSATALDAALTGDVFSAVYGSAATTPASGADAQSALTHAIFDVVVVNGMDVGYTIATNAATTGTLTFHVWWQPLSATGAVAAGAGGAL